MKSEATKNKVRKFVLPHYLGCEQVQFVPLKAFPSSSFFKNLIDCTLHSDAEKQNSCSTCACRHTHTHIDSFLGFNEILYANFESMKFDTNQQQLRQIEEIVYRKP